MAANLPSEKSQDISIILSLVNLEHSLHRSFHIIWDRTESKPNIPQEKNNNNKKEYAKITDYLLSLDSVCCLPDGVEDIHRVRASLYCQNSTGVFARIAGLIQVEEVMEFLHIIFIFQLIKWTLIKHFNH